MPLFHQAMAGPFGLNRQAVEHARLADREIADVDHLLHFAFAFGDDLTHLEGDEFSEIRFRFAQCIAELAHGFTPNRRGGDAPFQKRLRRPSDDALVIFAGGRADAREQFAIDGRKLLQDRSGAVPFAVERAGVFLSQTELLECVVHKYGASLHLAV